MKTPAEERREYERVIYGTELEVDTDGDRFNCVTLNISRGGILIKTEKSLRLGQTISMRLPLTDSEKSILVDGSVVRKAGDCFGIKFSSPLKSLPLEQG